MNHTTGSFCGAGGIELFYQAWLPGDEPTIASIGIVHGMGDHSGRFERLVQPLTDAGIAVHGFDLRGFGRSPGRKGHIAAWREYREDARAFVQMIMAQTPGVPVFLLGYSLGAAIVMDSVMRDPTGLRGAIFIGAPLEPAGVASEMQIRMARVLSRVWPSFSIAMNNDIDGVSRDPDVLAALITDPLHHNRVTARWGTESMAATDWVRERASEIRLPVLFLHGGDDPFNLVSGTQRFFEQIPYADKTLKVYPGSRHEIHNDLDHAQVAADIIDWIKERS